MHYEFPLLEEKVKPHQVTSMHLISSLTFTTAGIIIFVYNFTITYYGLALLMAGISLLTVTIVKNKWLLTAKNNFTFRVIELIISLLMLAYSFYQHWKFPEVIFGIQGIALVAAMYMERSGRAALMLYIDEDGIKLPIPAKKRIIEWKEIDNMILKNGVLSVNCTDNTFMQWNIDQNNIDVISFKVYCEKTISENVSKRVSDDW